MTVMVLILMLGFMAVLGVAVIAYVVWLSVRASDSVPRAPQHKADAEARRQHYLGSPW